MKLAREMLAKFSIICGIAAIAYATITLRIPIFQMAVAVSLIAAGLIAWRHGPIWPAAATWGIAAIVNILVLTAIMIEDGRATIGVWDHHAELIVRTGVTLCGCAISSIALRRSTDRK
jgi:multisubunit Na+/H+ antiporter MnhC subunit